MDNSLLLLCTSPAFPLLHYVLDEGKYLLGRSSQCELVVNDASVSRQHAQIVVDGKGGVTLRDLSSRNGTYVNEQKIRSEEVEPGATIRFGKITFTLAQRADVGSDFDSDEPTGSISITGKTPATHEMDRSLSPAQKRVLKLLADGLAEKEIAAQLHLSPHTVHNHVRAIYQIFEVHSRPELLAKVFKTGR